ncbi:MGMT family protein [Blastococcus sp. SYSU DS0616]
MTDAALDVDEAVFDEVERIPPGRVSTYGAIGRLVGVGPRRVARALSSGGGAVPWYRVVRADGSAAEPVRARQLELLAGEGVPVRNGKVDLAAVGWPDRGAGGVLPRDDRGPVPGRPPGRCAPTGPHGELTR